ncbi:MAG: hypothetical protein LBB79_03730 [Prevotellaceae bacterium]|jgi:hypothetical protein|nr:hypothetical protein [Prevotellaceae bacterium]
MLIANPLYDVVFKYMMEDNKVAKKFISAIIDEQVEELHFAPQEYVSKIAVRQQTSTVCRLDFVARIVTNAGERRSVMVEVQKANISTDIMRFRQYLGKQYQSSENSYVGTDGKLAAMQIYCIFVLGDGLKAPGIPVLEVSPEVKDRATSKPLTGFDAQFIKSLHHRSWIVQVPELPKRRRNDLEKMLSIFDQSNCTTRYILNVREEEVPPQYRSIVRRLQQAASTYDMQANMEAEDFLLEAFRLQERQAQMQMAEKDKALAEKDKALAEKDKVLAEKDKALAEKNKALAEKDKVLEESTETLKKDLEESRQIIKTLERRLKGGKP